MRPIAFRFFPALILALLLALSLTACGGGDKGTDGEGGGGSGPISARIDGDAWSSGALYSNCQATGTPGGLIISGAHPSGNSATALVISLYYLTGPGTYPLGVGITTNGGTVSMAITDDRGGSESWITPLTGMEGSITFTKLDAGGVSGTFRGTLRPMLDPSGEAVTITEGRFDLPMKGTFSAAPSDAGNRVKATLNGVAFQAAGVTSMSPAQLRGPGLQFSAVTSTRSITLLLMGVTGPGSYALQDTVPSRILSVVFTNTASTPPSVTGWGPTGGNQETGTIVVTHLTATRAKGTFSATLSPQAGSSGAEPMVITDGEFDIAIP